MFETLLFTNKLQILSGRLCRAKYYFESSFWKIEFQLLRIQTQ